MDPDDRQEKLIEYLYGEISPEEKPAFQKQLDGDTELGGELKSYLQLRQLFHEHLPEQKAPRALTHKLLRELGLRRTWWSSWLEGFWRPALAGAFVLVLTLGITYTWQRVDRHPQSFADRRGAGSWRPARPVPEESGEDISDRLLAKAPSSARLRVPVRRYLPGASFPGRSPRVSLAGFGRPRMETPSAEIPSTELHHLEMEAEQALARFYHQQALRLRGMGEFEEAALQLGHLIKNYPFYPLKFYAMAQRVDCLFQAGKASLAREELRVLGSVSPNLAYLIERRWTGEIQE